MMTNEEREYQEFFAKTIKASNDFVNDYKELSPQNQLRFQQDLKNQAAYNALYSLLSLLCD